MSVVADYAQREGITVAEAERRISEMRLGIRMKNLISQSVSSPVVDPKGAISPQALAARFCAVAWLSGASYAQLAALFKISRQAIQNKVNRLVDPTKRAEALATQRQRLTYEQVVKMWEQMQEAHGQRVLESSDDALPPMEDKIG